VVTNHLDLGERVSVFRPSTIRLWFMSVIALALLIAWVVGILFAIDGVTSILKGSRGWVERARYSGLCVGGLSLFLVLFGGFLISDFRKWLATRTVRLTIYQKGFTYENQRKSESCQWDEIKDITYRVVKVHSKHSSPRQALLIRSVVKRDGEMISLAETLPLTKITSYFKTTIDNIRS
jgi:hypothetical protein